MTRLDSLLWRARGEVERHDAPDGSQVSFEFPLGFSIIATRRGVQFTGNSTNYDSASIALVHKAIDWANLIAESMRQGKGIPPQEECEGRLVLVERRDGAWWKGQYRDRIKETEGIPAARILRKMTREKECQTDKF